MLCYRIKFTFCSFVIKHVQHSTRDKIQIHTSAYSNSFPRFTMQVSPTILCDSRFSSYTCMVKTKILSLPAHFTFHIESIFFHKGSPLWY